MRCCSGVLGTFGSGLGLGGGFGFGGLGAAFGVVLGAAVISTITSCTRIQYLAKPSVLHHMFSQFFMAIVWFKLNNCMNVIKQKPKRDLLSHAQYEINAKQQQHTQRTDVWLRTQGIDASTIAAIDTMLLKAQQAAHLLLTHHQDLLTAQQRHTLQDFQQQFTHQRTRHKLKPQAAYPILNIQSKINRQLFKQHSQLQRQQST